MLMAFRYEERIAGGDRRTPLAWPAVPDERLCRQCFPARASRPRHGPVRPFDCVLSNRTVSLAFVFRNVVRIRLEVESVGPETVLDEIQFPKELVS